MCAAADDARRRQQTLEAGQGERARLDRAGVRFQQPVATQHGTAGGVGRRRDIGLGQGGQGIDERTVVGRQVAAVEEDVAVGRQRGADPGQHRALPLQRVVVHQTLPEDDPFAHPVAQDVDRAEVLLAVHRGGDLRQPVRLLVEHQHGRLAIQPLADVEILRDATIDDDQFARRRLNGGRRRGLENRRRAVVLHGGGNFGRRSAIEQVTRFERHSQTTWSPVRQRGTVSGHGDPQRACSESGSAEQSNRRLGSERQRNGWSIGLATARPAVPYAGATSTPTRRKTSV
ncbi:MAG: hypothetical protein AW10_00310 [Candidatus Accumulibacter appositus]|uniref:Uncharacterized protein n=1 Tax=Candidatus Accumulibacter appositus TaxID=1454003 RepID=A0A011Q116_9PROT|nr:MAG: hypothetical protein AW10_00310 [Candidatus Accumulibacter appositus]